MGTNPLTQPRLFDEVYDNDALIAGLIISVDKLNKSFQVLWANDVIGVVNYNIDNSIEITGHLEI